MNSIDTVGISTVGSGAKGESLMQTDNRLVYVVDDEKAVGEIVELLFQIQGFQTKMFTDPAAALDTFARDTHRPCLLISDYVMSPMNGMELITQCMQIEPKLKTILISGNVSEDILQGHAMKPGAFILKPFIGDILTRTAQKLLTA